MKVNIEGAEWYLFNDLVENDLIQWFDIYCGSGQDIDKIAELEDIVFDYYDLLKKHNVTIHRFSEYKLENNVDIKELIREAIV